MRRGIEKNEEERVLALFIVIKLKFLGPNSLCLWNAHSPVLSCHQYSQLHSYTWWPHFTLDFSRLPQHNLWLLPTISVRLSVPSIPLTWWINSHHYTFVLGLTLFKGYKSILSAVFQTKGKQVGCLSKDRSLQGQFSMGKFVSGVYRKLPEWRRAFNSAFPTKKTARVCIYRLWAMWTWANHLLLQISFCVGWEWY